MKRISFIHVGLGGYSLQRLQILLNNPKFKLLALVDIDKKKIKNLKKLKNLPENYKNFFFSTISKACKNLKPDACFIYVSSNKHAKLIIESLQNNLHTLCVKSLTFSGNEFKKIMKIKNKKKNILLVQGLNNQWNDASLEMQKIVKDQKIFGKFIMGYCRVWGRQNLNSKNGKVDTFSDGSFFHSMACHQLGQLVQSIGLPKTVYCQSPNIPNKLLGYKKVGRTALGTLILNFGNDNYFTYVGNRSAHGNPEGFAARWSGEWFFAGTKSDVRRQGGRITLYSDGGIKKDTYHSDIDDFQINDDKRQFNSFYNSIIKKNKSIEVNSLNTWLLMEACNQSSRKNKTIKISQFKNKLLSEL